MAKKVAYPVILKPDQEGYYVEIPDFDIATARRYNSRGYGNGQRCYWIDGD